MASLAPHSGVLGRRLAAHLLRRTTFGPSKTEIDTFAGLTADQAVDQLLLLPSPLPDHPKDPQTGATWLVAGRTGANSDTFELNGIIRSWYLDQVCRPGANPNLFAKAVFFLHTCFPTGFNDIEYSENFYYTIRLLMYYATGSYRDLAFRICLDNGMNNYLDIGDSEKGNPNQNFVREFFELHTIGKGPTQGEGDYTTFTEDDVEEAARLLTGYRLSNDWANPLRIDPLTGFPRCWFDLSKHDLASKTFSAAFQNTVIAGGTTEQGMIDEVDDFVNMIFAQLDTAKHICRRMYRFFVRYQISAEVEQDIISPMAQALQQNNYDLATAYRLLFKSQHFYDADDTDATDEVVGALIKAPLELQVGMMRFFQVPFPDPDQDLFAAYITFHRDGVHVLQSKACFDLFEPPEVAGYQPVYQDPEFNRLWISAKSIEPRYNMANEMIEGPAHMQADLMAFVKDANQIPDYQGADQQGNPGPHPGAKISEHLVNTLIEYLFPEAVPTDRFDYFHNLLLDNLSALNWEMEWDKYLSTNDESNVRPQIEKLVRGLLQSPEFQLA